MSTFLCIGDIHAPFICKPAFSKVISFLAALEKKPDYIIQIGDLYDFYSFSRFPRNVNIMTAEQEVLEGRFCAEEMWRMLKRHAPKAICYQLLGNHCVRPLKKMRDVFPEAMSIFEIKPLWKFDGVTTIYDPREELVIEDIVFIHGYRTQLGSHASFMGKSMVGGHSHRGGVVLLPRFGVENPIFELNAGYLAGPEDYEALKYTPQKWNNWTRGVGYIDDLGPRFIHENNLIK